MNKIKKGDDVIVLAGRDKGKRGTVLQVLANGKALVDDINLVKKHKRGNPQSGETGGIVEQEAAIWLSNLAVFNPKSGKGERVGVKVDKDGKKSRVFRPSGDPVEA